MSCNACQGFSARSSTYEEIAENDERHSTLYRCRICATYFELILEERSIRFTPIEELKVYFPHIFR